MGKVIKNIKIVTSVIFLYIGGFFIWLSEKLEPEIMELLGKTNYDEI